MPALDAAFGGRHRYKKSCRKKCDVNCDDNNVSAIKTCSKMCIVNIHFFQPFFAHSLSNSMMQMTSTCEALRHVLIHELPGNLASTNAALRAENARLRAEVQQLRAEAVSPYTGFLARDPQHQRLTWREFANGLMNEMRPLYDRVRDIVQHMSGTEGDRLFFIHVELHQLSQGHFPSNLQIQWQDEEEGEEAEEEGEEEGEEGEEAEEEAEAEIILPLRR